MLLGYAVLEGIALWVVLAFATALASTASLGAQHLGNTVTAHIVSTFIYFIVAMVIMPSLLKRISHAGLPPLPSPFSPPH